MMVSLTVGRVDAGVTVLLTEDKRHIEFPSNLLPQNIVSGSIIDITISQNTEVEQRAQAAFDSLQQRILNTYGLVAPSTPALRLRNATQTSLVLEWDPIDVATSTLKSLSLYRNGSKAGNIPRPMEMQSTKISGLAVDTEYSFYLVLRTTGGTYQSNSLTVKTHTMNNLTGITITPGVLPSQLRDSLETAAERIGAKIVDTVRIDTTHFVCTEGRGKDWERAVEMSIPVVRPEWLEGCEREGKIIGVRGYYLDANPKHRQVGSNPAFTNQQQSSPTPSRGQAPVAATSQTSLPSRPVTNPRSPGPESAGALGEPGPEVMPTPQLQQKDLPPTPSQHEQVDEEEEEAEEDDSEGDIGAPASKPQQKRSAPVSPPTHRDSSEEEDDGPSEKDIERNGDHDRGREKASGDGMEEVAL